MSYLLYIGPLAIPLLILSFIGLTIIIERLFFYARLKPATQAADFQKIKKNIENNSKQAKNIRDELASYLLIEAQKPYNFGIKTLRIIAVTSPMIGLLGTVLGIISSFKTISTYDGPVHPALIADGLWEAMLTTALGLAIALPCLLAAFIFARISEQRILNYEAKLNQLSLILAGVELDSD